MTDQQRILVTSEAFGQIQVERAVAEFRAGRPVCIAGQDTSILALSVEAVDADMAARLGHLAEGRARLAVPAPRLRRLGLERSEGGVIALPQLDLRRIATLSVDVDARIDAPVAALSPLDAAALELARIALVLPAVIIVPVAGEQAGLLSVTTEAIAQFRTIEADDLKLVARAPVPLEGAADSEFVIFRGGEGMRDQVAVIIGRPDFSQPVTVRLHSACLTGDLFGSLKCDCGDQLRHTAHFMAENGGGVLLYLDQEGRGNGISNKIRAYKLQAQGFDTYDADEVLGFDHDQRRFAFAALMLKQLGVTSVRVMTNNPIKIAALEDAGLRVASDQRIQGRLTDQNVRYLASKRDRAGHFLDVETEAVIVPPPIHGGAKD
ncbi:MAG: GTP cyclohydrolase II RibA [Beijerinckiaceae bacterium]|nr:GTP cyclohydrolase II RibA [Beijerinckiaceae bacterium]